MCNCIQKRHNLYFAFLAKYPQYDGINVEDDYEWYRLLATDDYKKWHNAKFVTRIDMKE